jgi:colicin import membrane protein
MAEIQAEMARQSALDAFQAKLAADKAAAAKSTAAYQAKVANDAKVDALMAELSLAKELAAFEAQLAAELASQEMMAEIQAEMARQSALDAFQAKLAADKAAAAKSTAAYQARIASEAIEAEIDKFEAQLMEELLEESTGIEITITGENHNLCRSTLGLSELNIQLYNKALLGGYLGSIGPQVENGTEFSSTRWDNYISCISSLNSEL